MIKTITKLLQSISANRKKSTKPYSIELAVCVLFIEMGHMDGENCQREIEQQKQLLKQHFKLKNQEITDLLILAQQELNHSTDYYQFTAIINQQFTPEEKINIIESLWKIAFADNQLNAHEEHYLRKICSLLHVSHKHFIQTKIKTKHSDSIN